MTLFYVGAGTLALFAMSPEFPLHGDWVIVINLLTLPVSFIGFGILYSDSNAWGLALIVQIIVFCIFWYILYKINIGKYSKGKKKDSEIG